MLQYIFKNFFSSLWCSYVVIPFLHIDIRFLFFFLSSSLFVIIKRMYRHYFIHNMINTTKQLLMKLHRTCRDTGKQWQVH